MNKITINIESDSEGKAQIYNFSDVHIGSIGFDEQAFLQTLDDIALSGTKYVIINGDMIDGIVRQDTKRFDPQSVNKEDTFDNVDDTIMYQCDKFIEYMEPLSNSGVQFIILEGNHETAFEKHYGFSPYRYICKRLDAIRAGQSMLLKVIVDDCREYIVVAKHGSGGGGSLAGSAINKAQKLASPYRCDFFTMGHVHKMNLYRDRKTSFEGYSDRWVIVTGCYMNSEIEGYRNYFVNSMTSNSDIGYAIMEMWGDKNKTNAKLIYL